MFLCLKIKNAETLVRNGMELKKKELLYQQERMQRERNGSNKKVCENGKEEKVVMREKETERKGHCRLNIYEFAR